MDMKFYKCAHCGQIVAMVEDRPCPVKCCGEPMEEIIPGTSDGALEKHVPVWSVDGNIVNVTVGSVEHPMLDEHYIQWIAIQTRRGNQRAALKPGDAPKAQFALLEGDEVLAVYEYCNLHGLFKA